MWISLGGFQSLKVFVEFRADRLTFFNRQPVRHLRRHDFPEGDLTFCQRHFAGLPQPRQDGFKPYRHIGGTSPARVVEWLKVDLPRDAVKQDLLYSMGASQTVCEISRNDAVRRVEVMAVKGQDPGPSMTVSNSPASKASVDVIEADQVSIDLAALARDQIERHISANFAGHAFTELIAAILRAQGYQTRVSPPGADRGIDILAGQGGLGFGGPRLVVQVKSGDTIADQPTLQSLIGCIADTQADHGLLVSWSGFTAPVRQRGNELYFRVRMWDRNEILNALLSVYDELPETIRADLPLQRLWSLVPSDNLGG